MNAEKAVLADTIQVAGNFNMTPVAARSWDRERLSAAACAAMLLFTASAAALVPEPYTSLIARWFLFVSVAAALAWLYYRLLRKARLMLYEQILVPHSIGATLSGLRLLWPSIIVTATSFTLWQALNKREERSRRAEVTATGWTGSASGINDGNEVELEPESWGAGPRNQGAQVTLLAPFSLSGIRLSDDGLLHLSLSITGNVHFVYVVPNETWISPRGLQQGVVYMEKRWLAGETADLTLRRDLVPALYADGTHRFRVEVCDEPGSPLLVRGYRVTIGKGRVLSFEAVPDSGPGHVPEPPPPGMVIPGQDYSAVRDVCP